MTDKEVRARAKELGIKSWHVKKIDKLKDEIVDAEDKVETPVVPVTVTEGNLPQSDIPTPVDPANPDAVALEGRQAEASMEARMKALEDGLVEEKAKNKRLEAKAEVMSREMQKIPSRKVPPNPNPNYMVYHEDQKDKNGKYFGKMVSPEEAKRLYEEGYVDTPAKLGN
jgi:hypothetical protein